MLTVLHLWEAQLWYTQVHCHALLRHLKGLKWNSFRLVFVRWKRPGAAAWAVFMAVLRAADMKQIFQQSCVRLPFPFSHMLFYWFQFQIMRSIYVKIINALSQKLRVQTEMSFLLFDLHDVIKDIPVSSISPWIFQSAYCPWGWISNCLDE